MQESTLEGYSYLEVGNYYGALHQRWLVVFSEAAYKRAAAKTAIKALDSQWKFHQATTIQLEKVFRYKRAGRPRKGEKPERIMALLMAMGLSLLVYALAERWLRTELAQRDESIPDQVGKPTQSPTMRRIFQVFQGIDVLLIKHPLGIQRQVLNLKPIHLRVLDLLGPVVKKYYIPDG